MNDFWNNILRYPRFFISSVSGLILVILTPFINLVKLLNQNNFIVFHYFFIFYLIFHIKKYACYLILIINF